MDFSDVVSVLALGGTVLTATLTYRASTRATKVQDRAVDVDAATIQLERIKELRQAQGEAERHADDLEAKVHNLKRQLDVVTREAEQLVAELQLYRRTAWRDGMTIDMFRQFIGPPASGVNGRS